MSWRRGVAATLLVCLAALYLVLRAPNLTIKPSVSSRQESVSTTRAASENESPRSAATSVENPSQSSNSRSNQTTPEPPAAAVTIPKPIPGGLEFTNLPPEIVLDNLRGAVRLYGSTMGGNPVGTNPEITSALNGNNPKQARFLDPAAGLRINDKGELIDPWGTPYFFHQLSGAEMEIRSAGPDKTMWTADDLVTR